MNDSREKRKRIQKVRIEWKGYKQAAVVPEE